MTLLYTVTCWRWWSHLISGPWAVSRLTWTSLSLVYFWMKEGAVTLYSRGPPLSSLYIDFNLAQPQHSLYNTHLYQLHYPA